MTGRPFVVHVAGEPGPDRVQRCVPCGAVLYDGRPWWEGRVAVPAGDVADEGPSWWAARALVATDKPHDGSGGGITYIVQDRAIAIDERTCTPSR